MSSTVSKLRSSVSGFFTKCEIRASPYHGSNYKETQEKNSVSSCHRRSFAERKYARTSASFSHNDMGSSINFGSRFRSPT